MNLLRQHFLEPFFAALRFFTRLPVPAWVGHDAESLNRAAPFFPAIGLVIGLASALAFMLASAFWPKTIAVLLAMGLTIYLTGAFHEDGLSDMVDGIGQAHHLFAEPLVFAAALEIHKAAVSQMGNRFL